MPVVVQMGMVVPVIVGMPVPVTMCVHSLSFYFVLRLAKSLVCSPLLDG